MGTRHVQVGGAPSATVRIGPSSVRVLLRRSPSLPPILREERGMGEWRVRWVSVKGQRCTIGISARVSERYTEARTRVSDHDMAQ